LLDNLQQEGELFTPVTHPLEDHNSILSVNEAEINAGKYLTAEEKA